MELNLAVTDTSGSFSEKVKLSASIFDCEFNETLIHQVVTTQMTNRRAGTKAQKTRSEVRGGGAKPWRQKGTGRARAGTICSPIWRTGGVTFAAKPHDFDKKINKKMFRQAMRSILSELRRQERLVIVPSLTMSAPKTRELVKQLKALGVDKMKVLLVSTSFDDNLLLATRNLFMVDLCDVADIDPVSLVAAEKVVVTVDALKQFEERLK